MEKNKLTFEQSLKKLEEIVNKLENGDINLDEAFTSFEEGLKLAKSCENELSNIEKKVAKIVNDGKETNLNIEEN